MSYYTPKLVGNPWIAQKERNNKIRRDLIELFEALSHRFTEWETSFTKSLKDQHLKGGASCTNKQAVVAERIMGNVYDRIEKIKNI